MSVCYVVSCGLMDVEWSFRVCVSGGGGGGRGEITKVLAYVVFCCYVFVFL